MLQECVWVFDRQLRKRTEQWLLDNYVPKAGTYILINMEKDFQVDKVLSIRTDKKNGTVQGETDIDYPFISFLDYYSKLIEMNKPIDATKIIHSNNMYSFFVKKESLEEKLKNKSIEGYYAVLKNPYLKYTKSKDKELYAQVEQELGPVDAAQAEQIEKWVKDSWRNFLKEQKIDVTGKDYLKLFFIKKDREQTKALFRNEGRRYLLPNIYNKNDYNCKCQAGIKGLPGNNMGLNAKKPYLANRSRKVIIPYMLTLDEALVQSQFFDFLAGQASKGKNNIYINLDKDEITACRNAETVPEMDTGIYLRIQQGKELEIHQMIPVTGYQSKLSRPFQLKEVLSIPEKAMAVFEPGYGIKTRLSEIETLVDEVFFSKRLKFNYFTKPEDLSFHEGVQKNMLMMYRERLWSWFYKGNTQGILQVLEQMALPLILESIQNTSIKPKHQFNLWISLADYFNNGGRLEQRMEDMRKALREHLDCWEEWMFSGDEEYFYAVGQLVSVFMGLSKAQKKNMAFVVPVLNAKNDGAMKDRLLMLFKKYAYAVIDTDLRIKALYSHIMRYEPEKKPDGRWISAGFADRNLVYMKKDSSKPDNVQKNDNQER